MSRRQLHIGLSLSPTWLRGAAWRDAASRVEDMFSPALHLELAQRAEQAKLDFLFRPDSLFLDPDALAGSPGFSSLDPLVQLAGLAQGTRHIGLVTTASTTFNAPYVVARQLQSLHWISNGRAGWNIVTSLDGERNFGVETMPGADWRYARAAEFTALVRALWRSYPGDALRMDREAGRFADTDRIRPVGFAGRHFAVEGPLTTPCHPAGPPPLFQAGASPAGRAFAAAVADAIFASTPDMAAAIALRQDLRSRARQAGRPEDAIRVLPGLAFVLEAQRAEAHERFHALQGGQSAERRYAFVQNCLGIDLRPLPHDAPIPAALVTGIRDNVRSRTHAELLLRLILGENPTIAELLRRPETSGSGHWQVVGTPDDLADAIAAWFAAGALDGIVALPGTMRSLELFLDAVVPRLADQGLFRTAYAASTLAGHLGIAPAA